MPRWIFHTLLLAAASLAALGGEKPPHAQSKIPGPPLTPQEAMAKMVLPEGFKVSLCVAESELINPTAMTFDDRGRIWVCESFEYPRAGAGPGKDRVKILEDADGDGVYEKVTVFKEGLNIPCGVCPGNGGVYITNSPDILFLQDTNGDGVCDKEEVILTGFGRADRHELPNNLMWGPDGWLYGMNGVFNPSTVVFDGKTHKFTCAVFRYHPKWKKFELFAEGTSNPWGLDYNAQGDWFVSCCVIDHLFHITQSGYYLRQGGAYPELMAKQKSYSRSITTEKHQQAAYAGLCVYNGDAYPEEYRGLLFMGNLHGSCINVDVLSRNGSTYTQKNKPDFVSAGDAWFMPVAQRVGPDGCIYVMDWYDRYHCYQDANRDPAGIDRTRGRIYRIAYKDTPLAKKFDLGKASKDELLKLLGHPNGWWRRQAQRLLNEKFVDAGLLQTLQTMALDANDKTEAHTHALWLLCSQDKMDPEFHLKLLGSADPVARNWGVRACGQLGPIGKISQPVYEKLKALAADPVPDVRVQVAVAAGRLGGAGVPPAGAGETPAVQDGLAVLFAVLAHTDNGKDPLIPNIVFNNLRPLAASRMDEIFAFIERKEIQDAYGATVVPWITEVMNVGRSKNPALLVADIRKTLVYFTPGWQGQGGPFNPRRAAAALQGAIDAFDNAGLKPAERAKFFDEATRRTVAKAVTDMREARLPAIVVSTWWNDPEALKVAANIAGNQHAIAAARSQMLRALAESKDATGIAFDVFAALAVDPAAPALLRKDALEGLAASENPKATSILLAALKAAPADQKAFIVNGLIRNAASAGALIEALEKKEIPPSDLNSNHVRQIMVLNDAALSKRIVAAWGTVRTDRDPERVEVIQKMREVYNKKKGDAVAGWKVFETKCQQCHIIYGKGTEVGPDLTGVGRQTLDAVLTNMLDPNLEVGKPYYQYLAKTKDGKVVTGIMVEESDARVILKREGAALETIPKTELVKLSPQTISLMPEGLEKNMSEQEFRDLVEFLLSPNAPKR